MRDVRVRAGIAIYVVLGAAGWALCGAYGWSPWQTGAARLGHGAGPAFVGATAGVAFGCVLVAASQWLVGRSNWAANLTRELQRGLLGLDERAAAPLAVASALGEELFFRGFVQTALVAWLGPIAGVAAGSAIFGIAHVPWNRRLLGWTLMAAAVGLLFGAVYQATGDLWFAITAHATINFANLRFIMRFEKPSHASVTQRTDRRAAAGT